MFTLLDRQLVRSFLKAYVVCLVSLLGMYVVIDLFMNLDDFTQNTTLGESLRYIGSYYGCKIAQIFDRLCEAIALLAAMFTIAWMQRNNEILPLLSAGVSTRRVLRPVLIAAFGTIGLSSVNQELILPLIDSYFVESKGDPGGERETLVKGAFDSTGIHISGRTASRKDLLVRDFTVVIPQKLGEGITHLQAKEARYVPPDADERFTGGWKMKKTTPAEIEGREKFQELGLELIVPGEYFLKTKYVDFEVVTRSKSWYTFIPTHRLLQILDQFDSSQLASVAVVFHMRLTRPVVGMILVFMGLSVILRDQNRNVFISAGLCLVLCAVFFAALFACKYLGDYEQLSPALAAWLPVLGFGPLSFVMFDAVHT
jgi:lipopolysaccharide export system permease protein